MDCQGPKTNSLRKIACGRIYKQNVQSEGQNRVENYSKTTPNWYQICGRIYKRNVKSEGQNRVENYPKTTKLRPNVWKSQKWLVGSRADICDDPFWSFFGYKDDFWSPAGRPRKSGSARKWPEKFNTASFCSPGARPERPKVPPRASREGICREVQFFIIFWMKMGGSRGAKTMLFYRFFQ